MLSVVLSVGCGGQERPSPERRERLDASDPGLLMRGLVRSAGKGRYGEMWDALEPGGQRLVNRERFAVCLRQVAAGAAIPLSEIPVTVVRVRKRGQEAAVVLRAATPVGPVMRTVQAIEINGRWRWRLPSELASAFAGGRCPPGP
ncbi:MAG: hypothetical protein M3433_03575 [Actinomycetota bacterium]|nr:hypothetical protein [Actinomycetota bacterium]